MAAFEHEMKNYYEILGLEKGESDPDKIKKAYRKESLKVHPDKHPKEEVEQWSNNQALVNEAYAVLSDPQNKSQYDFSYASNQPFYQSQKPAGYEQLRATANEHNQSSALNSGYSADDADRIVKDFFNSGVNIYIHIPSNTPAENIEIKVSDQRRHGQNNDFQYVFPRGQYVNIGKLTYDPQSRHFNLEVLDYRKNAYSNSGHASLPAVRYAIKSKSFLLAIMPRNDNNANPLVIGMISVSAGHKFAVFSFIDGLSEENIKKDLWTDGWDSSLSRSHSSSASRTRAIDYVSIATEHLILGSEYSLSLDSEETNFANDQIARLRGKFFNTGEKISAIESAVKNDSRQELVKALEIQRIGFFSSKPSWSVQVMPESLQIFAETRPNPPLAIEHKL